MIIVIIASHATKCTQGKLIASEETVLKVVQSLKFRTVYKAQKVFLSRSYTNFAFLKRAGN